MLGPAATWAGTTRGVDVPSPSTALGCPEKELLPGGFWHAVTKGLGTGFQSSPTVCLSASHQSPGDGYTQLPGFRWQTQPLGLCQPVLAYLPRGIAFLPRVWVGTMGIPPRGTTLSSWCSPCVGPAPCWGSAIHPPHPQLASAHRAVPGGQRNKGKTPHPGHQSHRAPDLSPPPNLPWPQTPRRRPGQRVC